MKKIFSLMIILLLIFQYSTIEAKSKKVSTPTVTDAPKVKINSNKPKSWQPEIKVKVLTTDSLVKLSANLPSHIINAERNYKIKNVSKNKDIVISNADNKINIDGHPIDCSEIELRPSNEADLKIMQTLINGKPYFGGMKIISVNNHLIIINIVAVEEYLRGVLPKEMSPSWNEEALKSQAVAARTFALKNRKRHQSEGYDLCNTTHCQVYNGAEALDERTDEAIIKTFGEVLYHNGKLIEAPFHTDSGGMTENAVDVWGTDYPYLRAATEIETKTQAWTVKFTLDDFSKKLAANKKNIGSVHFIKVTNLEIGKLKDDRSTSGRVKELTIIGTAGQIKVSGDFMRSIFNLKSTLFDIGITGNEVAINGFGWGHGVGLSQYGAENFAEHNYTYDKILSHYYKGTNLKRLY